MCQLMTHKQVYKFTIVHCECLQKCQVTTLVLAIPIFLTIGQILMKPMYGWLFLSSAYAQGPAYPTIGSF